MQSVANQTLYTNTPALLLNPQGWAQTDFSMRAGSYEGTGLLLNGLELKVPWSAHFNAELPLPELLFSSPELQTGLKNSSSFSDGAIALQLIPQPNGGEASMRVGTRSHYTGSLASFYEGIGGFIDGESARGIDASANDLDRYRGGILLQKQLQDWQINLLGSGQKKTFGAQGYYGHPADLYAEETTEDALFSIGATKGDLSDRYFRATALWRQFDDAYTAPTQPNLDYDVRSRYAAILLEGRTIEIQNIALFLRGQLENEAISGSEGRDDRTRGNLLFLPQLNQTHFQLKAGFATQLETSQSIQILPRAGIDFLLSDNSTLYASYLETDRAPDYQTLTANPLLEHQKFRNAETGFRQILSASFDWRTALFYRHQQNASDWMAGTPAPIGTLKTTGLEAELHFYPSSDLDLRLFYQWAHKNNDRTDGLYTLDYPEHLLQLSGLWRFTPSLMLTASQTLRYQTANDLRVHGKWGAPASIGLHFTPPFAHTLRLSLLVDNLWGTDFQPIPGLNPTPRTYSASLSTTW